MWIVDIDENGEVHTTWIGEEPPEETPVFSKEVTDGPA